MPSIFPPLPRSPLLVVWGDFDGLHEDVLVLDLLQRAEAPLDEVLEGPPAVVRLLRERIESLYLSRLQLREGRLKGVANYVPCSHCSRAALVMNLEDARKFFLGFHGDDHACSA